MGLTKFLVRRILQGVLVLIGVITVLFILRVVTPGSPVDMVAPLDVTQAQRQQIARDLGLHRPIYIQYLDYMASALQGDLGYSYISGASVSQRVFGRVPATVELAVAATLVAVAISIPLGVLSAIRRHQPADYLATLFSLLGISTPNFWLGIMLILMVSVELNLLPTSRRVFGLYQAVELLVYQQNAGGLRVWLSHIILPAITLGTFFTALITRLTRSGMLDELGQEYVRAARARGIPQSLVLYKHALRNTLLPIITVLGLQLGSLIGGAVITEAVFDWPGLGTLVINSVNTRDWPLIQGSLLVIGAGFVAVNIAVDFLYAYFNPKVAYS